MRKLMALLVVAALLAMTATAAMADGQPMIPDWLQAGSPLAR